MLKLLKLFLTAEFTVTNFIRIIQIILIYSLNKYQIMKVKRR